MEIVTLGVQMTEVIQLYTPRIWTAGWNSCLIWLTLDSTFLGWSNCCLGYGIKCNCCRAHCLLDNEFESCGRSFLRCGTDGFICKRYVSFIKDIWNGLAFFCQEPFDNQNKKKKKNKSLICCSKMPVFATSKQKKDKIVGQDQTRNVFGWKYQTRFIAWSDATFVNEGILGFEDRCAICLRMKVCFCSFRYSFPISFSRILADLSFGPFLIYQSTGHNVALQKIDRRGQVVKREGVHTVWTYRTVQFPD